jgi:HlyD family secretion protein
MFRDTSATDRPLSASHGPHLRKFGLLALGLGGLFALGMTVWPALTAERTMSRERVRIAAVERGTLVRDVSAQGRVVAARSPILYTPAAGIVRYAIEPGASVSKGDLLAEVDSPELTTELARERSNLTRLSAERERQLVANRRSVLEKQRAIGEAEVALRAAERSLERNRWAHERGAIPEINVLSAEDEVLNARSRLATAKADLELEQTALRLEITTDDEQLANQRLLVGDLERRVEELKLRAPFDGIVGNWLAVQRASVAANQGLLMVVDLSELEIEAQVSEVYADALTPGQPAEIGIGGERHRGEVRLISPEVTNAQVVARIRLVDASAAGLRQNQRADVRVLLEERPNVLLVERGPTFEREGNAFAWVVEGNTAVRTPIRLGATSVKAVEVLSGLEAGDQVIVAGLDDMRGVDQLVLTR